jgi:glycerol-3-phosphate O-acyltransferase
VVIASTRRAARRSVFTFLRNNQLRLEAARFIQPVWVRQRLAMDPQVDEAVLAAQETTGEPLALLRDRVDRYTEEICPYFSITAYYRLGATLARWFVDFTFELVVDPADAKRQVADVPDGALRVYLFNHRSNFDPVVLAHGLMREVAVSVAVGEWALVWPLDRLFRMFGGYFVRRGEKDPLYHEVLRRFLQITLERGAVTGFFIEGGLSRDGALRAPKLGLLDHVVTLRREHPDRDIWFLPVAINYDRVLEDRILVKEADGPLPKPSLLQRLINLGALALWVPWLIVANVWKVATRSHRKLGYAAIRFGEPLRLDDWPGGAAMHTLDDAPRRDALEALARELLVGRVGGVLPATPVPILCEAFLREGPTDPASLRARVLDVLVDLRTSGATVTWGASFAAFSRFIDDPSRPAGERSALWEREAATVYDLAAMSLVRRGVLRRARDGTLSLWRMEDAPVVAYYANSIRHHLPGARVPIPSAAPLPPTPSAP